MNPKSKFKRFKRIKKKKKIRFRRRGNSIDFFFFSLKLKKLEKILLTKIRTQRHRETYLIKEKYFFFQLFLVNKIVFFFLQKKHIQIVCFCHILKQIFLLAFSVFFFVNVSRNIIHFHILHFIFISFFHKYNNCQFFIHFFLFIKNVPFLFFV